MEHDIKYEVNEKGKEYVGIELKKNRMTVKLPIGYGYCEEEKQGEEFKKEIRKMMTILSKKTKITEEITNQKQEINFDFIACLKVVNDYKNYGLYKQMELRSRNNGRGRINWAKTMRQQQGYLKNEIFFTNLIYDYTDYKAEREIQAVQEFCLYQISKNLGHLLDFSYPKNPRKLGKNEMIISIKKELENTNEDIKIEMLHHLLNFVENTNINAIVNGNISIKYKQFEYIYQSLVDILGISLKEKSRYNPKAKYEYWERTGDKKEQIAQKTSYPDTIIRDEDSYKQIAFILDAKYKKIGSLPNEYDIFKQIRYAKYIDNKLKEETGKQYKIINAFIMPQDLPNDIIKIENYYARSEDLEERIFVVYVDMKSMILANKNTVKKLLELLVRTDEMIQMIEKNEMDKKEIAKSLKKYRTEATTESVWGSQMADKLEDFIKRAYPSL